MDTKYKISAPVATGLENLRRLDLNSETSLRDDVSDFIHFSDVLTSAHAPTSLDNNRLNIAATDAEFRKASMSVLFDYIDRCAEFPKITQLNVHYAHKRWISEEQTLGQIGDYEIHISSIRQLGDYAAKNDIQIVLENQNSQWKDNNISTDTLFSDVDWDSESREAFGMAPEEWIQMCLDADHENVRLCLDSSHVCTYSHRFPESERENQVLKFLSRPDLIDHVHWSDNYLYDNRGRSDSHLPVGKGSLPIELHKDIKKLDATLLLEHFYTIEDLAQELDWISSL